LFFDVVETVGFRPCKVLEQVVQKWAIEKSKDVP